MKAWWWGLGCVLLFNVASAQDSVLSPESLRVRMTITLTYDNLTLLRAAELEAKFREEYGFSANFSVEQKKPEGHIFFWRGKGNYIFDSTIFYPKVIAR